MRDVLAWLLGVTRKPAHGTPRPADYCSTPGGCGMNNLPRSKS